MTDELADAYAHERDVFVRDLAQLDEHQWALPSLCTGWSVRDVVAHLMMPFELGLPKFLGLMFTAQFNFDRLSLRWATNDRRTPAELTRAFADAELGAFNVPGSGPLAPLSHLSIHGYDIRGALGIETAVSPEAARRVLDDVTRGKHALSAKLLAGLTLEAVDAEWIYGQGDLVSGPGGVLLSALSGRTGALDQLVGDGVAILRSRLE